MPAPRRKTTKKASQSIWGRVGLPLGVGFFFFGLFLLTCNQIFSFDALTNALACEINQPIRWFHSNHPLYPFLGVVWYKLERLFGYTSYSIYSLARFNSLLMATGLGLLAFMLEPHLKKAKTIAMVGFFGSCYAVWHYAVDGRAVGTSVFFGILVLFWLFQTQPKLSWLPFLSSLYILVHGIAIFHVLGVFWFLLKTRSKKQGVLYLTMTGLLVFLFYGGIFLFVINPKTETPFLDWVLGYAAFDGGAQSDFWATQPVVIFKGLWEGWINALVYASPLSHLIGLISVGAVTWAMVRHRRDSKQIRVLVQSLFIWGLGCLLFLAFWSPGQEGFRLHVLLPWVVLVALCFRSSKNFYWGVGVMATVVFCLNFSGPISTAATIKNNQGYQILKTLRSGLEPGDIFLSAERRHFPNIGVLLPYFFPEIKGGTLEGRLFAFREKSLDPLYEKLQKNWAEGRRVFFASDFFRPSVQKEIEKKAGLKPESIPSFLSQFDAEPRFQLPNALMVFEIKPK